MALNTFRNAMRQHLATIGFRQLSMIAILLTAAVMGSTHAGAQQVDSSRVRGRLDTVQAPNRRVGGLPSRLIPPISPKRAFLYSLALPGYGQSRLDRGTSGAFFASIELGALAMVRRSQADVREARRFRADSLPSEFTVVGGVPVKSGALASSYTADLVRARRLAVEDWLALLAFNHLLGAADAFVSAQLWDVPVALSALPSRGGASVVATLRW